MDQSQPNFKQKKKKIKSQKKMVPIQLYRVQHLESINLVFSNTLKKGNKINKNLRKEKKFLRKTRKPW